MTDDSIDYFVDRNISFVGVAQSNRPAKLWKTMHEGIEKKHHLSRAYCDSRKLFATSFYDSKIVNFLSNTYDSFP